MTCPPLVRMAALWWYACLLAEVDLSGPLEQLRGGQRVELDVKEIEEFARRYRGYQREGER